MSITSSTFLKEPSQRLARNLPFYYGWVMLPIAMLAAIATSPGQTYGVSIFNESIRTALGLSHSQLTGAYMVGTLLAALPQSYIGSLTDRFGIRQVMFVVVVLFGLACMFLAQVQTYVLLFVGFFLIRLLGQGALSLMASNTLAMWFQAKLGTVAGIMNVGVAGAIALAPTLFLLLINQLGWRGAYVALGVLVWLLLLPLLLFLYRNRPEDVGQKLDGRSAQESAQTSEYTTQPVSFSLKEAMQTRTYWIMLAISAAFALIITAVFFNIVPIFTDHGLTAANAAATYTTIAIALATMQLIGGILADRFNLNWLAALCITSIAVGLVMLNQVETVFVAQLYALFIGMGQGLFGAVTNTVWVRYFGRTHLGSIRGSVTMAMVAGSSAGPFIMGVTYDLFGSYSLSLNLFIGLLVPLAIAAFWATPPCKKHRGISIDEEIK